MEANAGESFQMQILFNIFPRISLHCKLVPVQYWEYEYGLLSDCDLDDLMRQLIPEYPTSGLRMLSGHLLKMGVRVPRKRLRESLSRVDLIHSFVRQHAAKENQLLPEKTKFLPTFCVTLQGTSN